MVPLAFVIEDDEDLSVIFTEALQNVGYDVKALKDGVVAREALRESVPNLILLDMHLPHVSGAELFDEIKQNARYTKTIIIITTADARLGEMYQARADFVLIKPISFTQLRDLTNRLKSNI